jgi:hypothetical protein
MKYYLFVSIFLSTSILAQSKDGGFVFSVSASPKANQSKFTRNDDSTSKTYVGSRYKAQAGYKFNMFSLLGNLEYAEMENKSVKTQERIDMNYGATLRFSPIMYFYLDATYLITQTNLSYSDRAKEEFEGDKMMAGAGIRIPTPAGPYFTVHADYILNSRMRRKGGGDASVIDEEGYTISVGGTLAFGNK